MGDEYLTNFLQSGVVELFRSHLLSFCHNYVCSDPTYFVFSRIHKDVYGDTSLRIQNLEMLVKQLKAYYQVRVPRVACFDKGYICFGFALWGSVLNIASIFYRPTFLQCVVCTCVKNAISSSKANVTDFGVIFEIPEIGLISEIWDSLCVWQICRRFNSDSMSERLC